VKLSAIYSQAFKIVKRHKVLWVFGLVVAALGIGDGVGFGNSFSRFGNTSNFNFDQSSVSATTQKNFGSILSIVGQVLGPITSSTWIILALGILLAILICVTISVLLYSWAVGSLIGGTFDALDDRNEISLATVGYRGLRSFKNLAALYVFPPLVSLVIFVPLVTAGAITLALHQTALGVVLIILGVLELIIVSLIIGVATLWTERLVAIEGLPWNQAFFKGLRLLQEHFGSTLKLGIANTLTGCGLGCLLTAVVGPLIAILVLFGVIPFVGWVLLPVIIPLILLIVVLAGVFSALILTFKYVTWSILYKEIREGASLN